MSKLDEIEAVTKQRMAREDLWSYEEEELQQLLLLIRAARQYGNGFKESKLFDMYKRQGKIDPDVLELLDE